MEVETLLKDSWEIFQKNMVPFIIATLIFFIASMLRIIPIIGWFAILLIPPLLYGLTFMAVKGKKGETVEINDFFVGLKSNEFIQSLIVCGLLIITTLIGIFSYALAIMSGVLDIGSFVIIALMSILGIISFILGIIQSLLLIYAMPLLVIREYKGIDAIKEAIELLKANTVNSIILAIILFILNVIGFLLLIVGSFVTIPISIIACVIVVQTLVKNLPDNQQEGLPNL